ncbi:MAG: iron-only hydrogenase system regulator [Desulfovibrionaceae bacterium]|nr:iron-only hydrogenase system regulator [Desulfovibrionaceae bacterium]
MAETRLGTVGIVVEDFKASAAINAILHQHADIIVGRLGIPYRQRGVAVIALVVDGSMEAISAMTGKLGQIPHVSVKLAITRS